jgi:hypothetical protein
MGYEAHITRKENWFDDGPEISLIEWLDVVRTDPEMRNDGYAETLVGGDSVLRVEDPSMSVWLTYPEHLEEGNMAWMWLSHGNIVTKNPDEEMIGKMFVLAQRLSAKVQGDEGEVYGIGGQLIAEAATNSGKPHKPWWRFWQLWLTLLSTGLPSRCRTRQPVTLGVRFQSNAIQSALQN